MAVNQAKPFQNAVIKAGQEVLAAGQKAGMLVLLHEGEVSYFTRAADGTNRKIYSLTNNTAPGFNALVSGVEYPCSIVATKDSRMSGFPVKGNFSSLIMGKLNVGMITARSLLQEVVQSYNTIKKLSQFLVGIQRTVDNTSIVYYRANPDVFKQPEEDMPVGEAIIDPVLSAIKVLVAEFEENGGQIPEPVTTGWLEQDHSRFLKKHYEFESSFDVDEFNFVKAILGLPANIQGAMYKSNLNILYGLCLKLSAIIGNNLREIQQLQYSIDVGLESMIEGDYCLVEKYFLLADVISSGFTKMPLSEFSQIAQYLHNMSQGLLKNYQATFDNEYPNVTPSLGKLHDFLNKGDVADTVARQAEEQKAAAAIAAGNVDMEAVKKELGGSMQKILLYVEYPATEAKAMSEDMKKLASLQNPLDSSGDPRKLRRNIAKHYWAVYEKAYQKHKAAGGDVPLPVRLMLYYGFFDDGFLDDEHLAQLFAMRDETRGKPEYPIIDPVAWLDQVASKEEPPSVDEMGQTFFERLKLENKEKGWKRESDVPEEYDNYDIRIKYEINNFMDTNVRLTTGSPTTAFPILTKYAIAIDLPKAFVSKQRLSEVLDKIVSMDFSAFHREILLNDEQAGILKEFIMSKVIPNFILVPSIGTKVMMWQDLSTRSKASRGRFAIPVFATADLFTLILEAVGAFRWELTKSIMGADWNNVANSSITADYTDYVQFFKKNRELSQEQKEKLATEFKRFRSDRDRFVNDYIQWLKFESEGVLKLNKVARGIFYKHVPFEKEIRDNLSGQPAYSDIHNRFKNIRNRKLKELEIKYRKYQSEGTPLPDILQKNLDFWGV